MRELKTVLEIEWHRDSDPETIERKLRGWAEGIRINGLPYGVLNAQPRGAEDDASTAG